jgi:glucokinase
MSKMNIVLGIDIGGTNTSFGFVDRAGTIIAGTSMETKSNDAVEDFVTRLHRRIEKVRRDLPSHPSLCGIGIGAPNANYYRGTIEKAVHLNWGGIVDFAGLIRKYYNIPVSITNDANAAAIGEMLFGNARGMKNFMVITLGTGLGSGIVVDGRLLYGADGFARELGHTVVDPEGRQCRCGKKGCLETYASATGLVRTALLLINERCDPSPLRAMDFKEITSKMIFELAQKGDEIALEAFDQTAKILGMKLADAVALTGPEAIFLSGGLSMAGDILLKPTQQYMEDFLFSAYKGSVKLMLSGMEPGRSAILGAAALVWSELDL